MTPKELFEPTVMFFGLANFLVMFQIMINKILQNLINTGKVVSFINGVIVGIEEEEEHDKIVEEVVKRLAENNLYVKLEKYKLNQLTPKEVKNVQKFLELANYY